MVAPIVIGLTGSFGSGCTTVSERLEAAHKFRRFSLGEILRRKAAEANRGSFGKVLTAEERSTLQDFGDELRQANPAFLAEECIKLVNLAAQEEDGPKTFAVDSIRNPAEVEAFRSRFPRFFLAAINAPWDERWNRVKAGDQFKGDQDRFEAQDERDRGEGQPKYGQGVQTCVDLADAFIDNSKPWKNPVDKNYLWQQINEFVALVLKPGSREPVWDELYMGQAYAASLRSNCNKRKVGAAITRYDRRVEETGSSPASERASHAFLVSTGWNHVPVDGRSCRDLGDGSLDYCVKDEDIKAALAKMKCCPGCGEALESRGELTTGLSCGKCGQRIVRAFWPGRQLDLCPAVHAEEAAILQAAKLGSVSVDGAVLYTTTFPCLLCAKMIIRVGIREVVFAEPYPTPQSYDLLGEAGIRLKRFQGVTARAYFRLFT